MVDQMHAVVQHLNMHREVDRSRENVLFDGIMIILMFFNGASPEVFELLKEFQCITQASAFKLTPPHDVKHFIETTGPPVFAKPSSAFC